MVSIHQHQACNKNRQAATATAGAEKCAMTRHIKLTTTHLGELFGIIGFDFGFDMFFQVRYTFYGVACDVLHVQHQDLDYLGSFYMGV